MTDEIRAEITNAATALCHYPSGPHPANSCCSGIGRCEMKAAIAEITRLRAERDAERSARFKAQGEFSDMQRRIARQRRALAKLYQRRHHRNALVRHLIDSLATARRDALAEIKQNTDELIEQGRQDGMEEAAQWHDEQAAQAQKLSDMKVSAQDQKVWGDYATNHREYAAATRAAAGEEK